MWHNIISTKNKNVLVYLHYNIDRLGFVIVVLNYNLQWKMIELRLS
jgi:hypothetical protein